MNRSRPAPLAALGAVVAVVAGLAVALVPASLMWGFHYLLALDWAVFWRVAVDAWMLGHGVDVAVAVDPVTAGPLGLTPEDSAFTLTLAPFGLAIVTAALAARQGRGLSRFYRPGLAAAIAIVTAALLSGALALAAAHPAATPDPTQAVLMPALVYAGGLAAGAALARRADGSARPVTGTSRVRRASTAVVDRLVAATERLPEPFRRLAGPAATAGAAAAVSVVGVAALVLAVALVADYANAVALYEAVQAGGLGGAVLTLAQLALLPVLVGWSVSWLTGPGFALGAGSSVSPFGTSVGPLPGLPVLGAVPDTVPAWAPVVVVLPVIAGLVAGVVFQRRLVARTADMGRAARSGVAALVAGPVAGVLLGVLTWWSAGAAGPGRLVEVGPNPWWVALAAAVEVGLGVGLGALGARRSASVPSAEAGRRR